VVSPVYVDDIILGSTGPSMTKELMMTKFEKSMIGKLHFLLSLEVNQSL